MIKQNVNASSIQNIFVICVSPQTFRERSNIIMLLGISRTPSPNSQLCLTPHPPIIMRDNHLETELAPSFAESFFSSFSI